MPRESGRAIAAGIQAMSDSPSDVIGSGDRRAGRQAVDFRFVRPGGGVSFAPKIGRKTKRGGEKRNSSVCYFLPLTSGGTLLGLNWGTKHVLRRLAVHFGLVQAGYSGRH